MERKIVVYGRICSHREGPDQQHCIGRELLRCALDAEYQIKFTEDMLYQESSGKPELKGSNLFFNISHCSGLVVCAVGGCPIGVDVEGDRRVTERLIRKVCSPGEQQYIRESDGKRRFLELWTLKESYLKMTGEGIRVPLNQVNFQFQSSQLPENGVRTSSEIISSREGFFTQIHLENQYFLSVCAKEPYPVQFILNGSQ